MIRSSSDTTMKLLILLFLVSMATMGSAVYYCPQFWNLYDGSCYRYFGERVDWDTAEFECTQFFTTAGNGHLASVHDVEENRFVFELYYASVGVSSLVDWVYDYNNRNPVDGIWIGLHQVEDGAPWTNTDGSENNYQNWLPNEPNNDYYQGSNVEDCVHIWRRSVADDTAQPWNDMYCGEVMPFVCKMPANEI